MMLPQVMLALTVILGLASAGRGTVYYQDGAKGSCGQANTDDAIIAAISNSWMHFESPSPYCGRQIEVKNVGSDDQVGGAGKTLTVTVADTCPSCGPDDVDLSIGAWNSLTGNAEYGTFDAQW
ncbi:hypothetical protein Egran_00068 [Elaphomyces granulatus]|uniref:RlpA-like protein double-psi beta-barrel domain-containing protein n=1 Tax=Elaphomyces granulatus TaxID=519963 RepID=A0A232M700_9EURO|nr:hypothetical protein Egran_00068 [Elaphomyces granulatus]